MPEKIIDRLVSLTFQPERHDPYAMDYAIRLDNKGQSVVMRFTLQEILSLKQQFKEQFPE